jgi:uncharacterized protein YbbK (DUF523 family)
MRNPLSNPQMSSWTDRMIAKTRDALRRMNLVGSGMKISHGGALGLVLCALLVGGISLAALGREGATKKEATPAASASTATKAKPTPAPKATAVNQSNSANGEQVPDPFEETRNPNGGQSQQPVPLANSAPFVPALPPPQLEDENYLREREEWFLADRRLTDGSIPTSLRLKAVQHVQNMIQLEKQRGLFPGGVQPSTSFPGPANWTLIGPQPINSTATMNRFNGGPTIAGRIAALAVDPTNRDIVYLGAAAGGVWKSTDAGANWTPVTDNQPSLSTGSIAIDPTAASCSPAPCKVIYVGTGEANNSADSYYGAGILKSTNGGSTWTQLGVANFVGPHSSNRTDGAAHVGALAVDPNNNQVILAGVQFVTNNTVSGLYRSIDGGANWTLVPTASGAPGTAIVFDPASTGVVYAALGFKAVTAANGVYRSTDHGATWAILPGTGANLFPTSGVGRIDLTLFPGASATTATLYAAVANSSGTSFLGMFKTMDSGTNWTKLINTPDACTASFGSQCFYDMIVRVDPRDVNTVFFGGSTGDADNSRVLFRSTDGGANWTSVSNGASGTKLHVDLHALAFSIPPAADRLYVGSDGGAWRSDNPAVLPVTSIDYTDLNSTLAITMYYPGHTADRSDENVGFGGSQDNGSHRYSGNLAWDVVTSGDGGYTAQDNLFPSSVYTTCQNICIFRSLVGGTVGSFGPQMTTGINLSDRVSFIAPLIHDGNTSGRLYYGTFQIYLTTDSATTWSSISPDLTGGSPSTIRAIAVSPSDSNTVYVGTSASGAVSSKVQKTTNALMGAGATWSDITSAATLPTGRTVTAIGVDPTNPQIAYLSYSGFSGCAACVDSKGRVFRTPDGGATWQDVSGTGGTALPNAPVNTLIVDPDLPNTIFVGTDVGVFRTADASQGAATVWTTVGTGLPNVIVNSLTGRGRSRILRAATSGRSTWIMQDTNVPLPAGPFLASMHPALATAGSATITGVVVDGASFTPSSVVQWNGSATGITPHAGTANQMTFDIDVSLLASGGANDVRVFDNTQTPNLSKKLLFMVVNPVPAPANINTNTGTVGVPVALTITGSNFVPGMDVIFNGFHNTNGVVSGVGTQIDITIPGSELPAPASTTVRLSNPPPGGGQAPGFFPFTISAASGGAITTSPVSVNFGNQAVSTTSAVTNVTITNSGVASVTLNGATTKTGANPGDFSVVAPTGGTACSFGTTALTVGASCTFGVQFTPSASNARSATINIPNTGSPNPQTLAVNGTGTGISTTNNFTNGGGNNLWTNTANWSLGHVPTSGETVTDTGALNITLSSGAQAVNAMSVNNGGTLTISGGSLAFTNNSTATNVTINGGVLTANPVLTISGNLTMSSGTLNGTGGVTVNGAMNWTGGTIGGNGGITTVAASGTLTISGSTDKVLTAQVLANMASATWTGTGNINSGQGATFQNNGTFDTQNNGSFNNSLGGVPPAFNNAGTFTKSAGGGTTTFSGQFANNNGMVNANNGTLQFNAGYIQLGTSTLTLNGGNLGASGATLPLLPFDIQGGTLKGNGTLTGDVSNAGTFAPGLSPGTLTITGNYTQTSAGTLSIELGGTASGQFDVLAISGTATLGGTLNVISFGGFTPPAGSSYQVATYASHTGDFTTKNVTVNSVVLTEATNATNVTLTAPAGTPASITATSGTPQSATINTAFAAPLVATVKDAGSNPVSGVTVTFNVPASGASGTFAGGVKTAATNASGVATSAVFTANATAGAYTVTATVVGVATPAIFSLTNNAGAAASITATSGTPQNATINTAFAAPLVATVKDAGSNPVSGVTVTFNAPASGASGAFAGGVKTATTNASGVATSAVFTANATAGAYTVTATVAGVATPANFLLTNNAGPAASIAATAGTPQSAAINAAFGTQLQATVKDAGSNPVSGVTVTFNAPASGASGTFAGGVKMATTNASGVATAPVFTANGTVGPYTATATVAGVATPANFSLTNNAGAAASIAATSGTPQSATINTAFAAVLVATVKDAGSNPVSGVTVTFNAPASGASGTFAGGVKTATTNASGVATSAVFTANATAGAYTVTATVAGVATPANFSLTNTAGAASIIVATSGGTQSVAINTAFAPLTATVKDGGGNGVSGVTVTFAAPASGASGAFAGGVNTAVTDASGLATAPTFTANSTTGTYTVNAMVPGVAAPAAFNLTNTAGAAASIAATSGTPQSATINAAFAAPLVATVKDAGSNPVSGVTVTFNAPASGASGTFAGGVKTATTNASGVATSAAFTANPTAGSYTVTATVAGVAAPANFSLTNNVGPAASVTATAGTPQSAAISTAFATQLQATVKDAGNNLLSGVTVTFTAPASGASGTFAGGVNTATTNASGVATSVIYSANATAGGPYNVAASVAGVATPANFSLTNTAGAPASVTATAGTPQGTAINTAFTTQLQATVKDAGSNPVSGVIVTFAAPASGASGTFAGGVNTATTNASGVATALVFTANATVGAYTVTATAAGVVTPANFLLTNNAGPAASITATAGTPQSATINTAFATLLQATVKDAGSNPVSGVTVTFAAPASGASGAFAGGVTTVTTNASGVATAPVFTANATAGSYTVTAKVTGVATAANFALINNPGPPASITATAGTPPDRYG